MCSAFWANRRASSFCWPTPLKGWLAVFVVARLASAWFYPDAGSTAREWFSLCAGIAAILGHNYTCWLQFKGGKGIATSAGVLVALVPVPLLIILAVWIIVFALEPLRVARLDLRRVHAPVCCLGRSEKAGP